MKRAIFVCLFIVNMAFADLVGYVGQGKQIYYTNFSTGQQTEITLSGLASNVDYFEAMDISPIDGQIYVIGHWESYLNVGGRQIERSLYKIDPQSGNVTNNVALLSGGRGLWEISGLSISSNGTPYAVEGNNYGDFYALVPPPDNTNPYVGVTCIGQTIPEPVFTINNSGKGIIWNNSPYAKNLYWLDLDSSTMTLIGNLNGDFSFFDYGQDDILYAWKNKTLYSINVSSLTSTSLNTFSYGDVFAIIPEPATLLLLGLGAVRLRSRQAVMLRRRRSYSG